MDTSFLKNLNDMSDEERASFLLEDAVITAKSVLANAQTVTPRSHINKMITDNIKKNKPE